VVEVMSAGATRLQRIAFSTSRLAELCSQKELVTQIGAVVNDWPLVVLKELVDNACDAAEEDGIAPVVEISVKDGEIIVCDNAPGLPAETVAAALDYTVRVSSKEAYVSPSRGQQGNALKCIFAMPFVLDGDQGETIIESCGQCHRITFTMDPVCREPRIIHEVSTSVVQNGTTVRVRWPDKACHILRDAKPRFVWLVGKYVLANPHLTIKLRWDDDDCVTVEATNPAWKKWNGDDPTSAHWYSPQTFERYISAIVARDQDRGQRRRIVREFLKELRGLSRTDVQSQILCETETRGITLETFFNGGREAVSRLLDSCKRHSKPVKPVALGLIGADHIQKIFSALGVAENSFSYRKKLGTAPSGLPYGSEAAYGRPAPYHHGG
jgi:DNA topoisomerase VI subunit B